MSVARDPESGQALTVETPAVKYYRGALTPSVISLARETPYTLFVNDTEILSIATLPTHLKELFVGFLVSEGVLMAPRELLDAALDHDSRIVRMELDVPEERLAKILKKGMLTSGCAGGLVFSVESAALEAGPRRERIPISCQDIVRRMVELDTYQGIYSETRGTHASSVADSSGTLAIREDLGRHNAVDKVCGHCFLNGIETRDKMLLTTGRITSEVLTKSARSRFPIVISRSSASATAITIGRQSRTDVVTYVRGGKFNYFDHGSVELS